MAFVHMVDAILHRHHDEMVRNRLANAFALLLPDMELNATRKEKRQFRDRFETFLNDTQGLLCL